MLYFRTASDKSQELRDKDILIFVMQKKTFPLSKYLQMANSCESKSF